MRKFSFKNCPQCHKGHYSLKLYHECSDKCRLLNNKNIVNDCWEWKSGKNSYGYGVFIGEKGACSVHRRSYEIFKGEIPKGKFVCHSCDNPSCYNPDHLWLGGPKENSRDAVEKGRTKQKKKKEKVDIENLRFLNRTQTATYLGLSVVTLQRWEKEGVPLKITRHPITKRPLYKKEDLDELKFYAC